MRFRVEALSAALFPVSHYYATSACKQKLPHSQVSYTGTHHLMYDRDRATANSKDMKQRGAFPYLILTWVKNVVFAPCLKRSSMESSWMCCCWDSHLPCLRSDRRSMSAFRQKEEATVICHWLKISIVTIIKCDGWRAPRLRKPYSVYQTPRPITAFFL